MEPLRRKMGNMSPFTLFVLLLLVAGNAKAAATHQTDYVIVGAGTAGCVLAARLCALLPDAKITLLERSMPRDKEAEFLVRSPRNFFNAFNSPKVSEIFADIPSLGLGNRSAIVKTGSTLGGSSSINGMQWVVPVCGTLEKWGISGLTTITSRMFYKRAFEKIGFKVQSRNLGTLYAPDHLRAAALSGYPEYNSPFDTSARRSMFENILAVDSKGFRVDSCTAYLAPVLKGECRDNLQLIQGATVTRVLLRGRRQRFVATGVEYVRSSDKTLWNKTVIRAKNEVILSAGPIGSPKLLQLSGIGPRPVLRKAGVKPKVILGVGAETQARAAVSITSSYAVPLEPSNNSTLLNSLASRRQWGNGKGGVFATSPLTLNGRDRLEAYLSASASSFADGIDKPYISTTCLNNPKSVGYLRIKDNNPFSSPDVQFALLNNESDIASIERCLNRILPIHRNFPPRFNLTFVDPPNGVITREWIRKSSFWSGHYVGGCPVGSVLQSNLQVRMVRHLRVVDTSVFSTIPTSAGPMATAYMLAEFMAEEIKKQWY